MNSDITIIDSAVYPFNDESTIIEYKKINNRIYYHIWLYLGGVGALFVDNVIYNLHPSFRNPSRKIRRTIENPNLCLQLWTWGIFEINVTIRYKDGRIFNLKHKMSYDKQIKSGLYEFKEVKG